jgi:hypothetical protein
VGFALGTFADAPHPQAWDRASELTVRLMSGTFTASVSEAALLADTTLNGFAIENADGEWEYARAATCVDNGDGTWTLSTWLRGQHGTEFAMADHGVGNRVVQIDGLAMARASDGDRTLQRHYVAVASGIGFSTAYIVAFTNDGKGLRPWSPVGLTGHRTAAAGDWNLRWNRRDRVPQNGNAIMLSGLQMNESVEDYDVLIYDGGGTLLNTYSASSEAFTYSAAQQVTDFGSEQASITVGVAQVSTVFGAGIEERVTL